MPVSTTRYAVLAPVKQFVGQLVDKLSTSKYKGKNLEISGTVISNKALVKTNSNIVQRAPVTVAKSEPAAPMESAAKPNTARYIESELHSSEFHGFLETIDKALDALRSKHDALFLEVLDRPTTEGRYPEQLEQLDKEFDAIRKHAFAEQYAAARKEGSSIADALKFAGAMAGEHAFIEFLTSDDPAHNGYAQTMKQFKQNIADIRSLGAKKAAVSVTYERAAQPFVPAAGVPGLETPLVTTNTKSPSKSVTEQKSEAAKHQDELASLRTKTKLPDAGTPWSVSPFAMKQTAVSIAINPATQEPKSTAPKKAPYDQFLRTDTLARQLAESAYADKQGLDSIDMMDMGTEVEGAAWKVFAQAFDNAKNSGRKESDALKIAHMEAQEFAVELLASPEMSDYKDYADFIKQHKPEFSESTSPYTGKTHIGIEYKFTPLPAAIVPEVVPNVLPDVILDTLPNVVPGALPDVVLDTLPVAAESTPEMPEIDSKAGKSIRSLASLWGSSSQPSVKRAVKSALHKLRGRKRTYDLNAARKKSSTIPTGDDIPGKAKKIKKATQRAAEKAAQKAANRVKLINSFKLPNTQ